MSIIYLDKTFSVDFLEIPSLTCVESKLFLDGLETGIIVSILLISQIMFVFIEIYWIYEEFKIGKNTQMGAWCRLNISIASNENR